MKTKRLGNSDLSITPVGFGARHGRPPGQIAIAWTLRNPAVTGAIVGARNAKQVEGNVGAAEIYLTDEEIAEIEGKNVREQELMTAA